MNLFPIISSHISIISPYILNIRDNKGGLMVSVNSHIHSKRLNGLKIPSNIQIIPLEMNPRKEKWLVTSIYNPPSQKNKHFLWYLTNLLEFYWTRYEEVTILGDFNIQAENKLMQDLCWQVRFTIWWNRTHVLKVTEVRAWIY